MCAIHQLKGGDHDKLSKLDENLKNEYRNCK